MSRLKKILIITFAISIIVNTSVSAQSNNLAQTPPMGWMSWYTFIDNINEELIMEVADAMVSSGLRDAGYDMIQLDDGWMAMSRDENGCMFANKTRFPNGLKFLGDYLHERGLKFGIYASSGHETCEGYPGSYNHEEIDANTFAKWGVDYLKYDACGDREGLIDKVLYKKMSDALIATGRPILYEICIYYSKETHLWGGEYGNMWRTGGDIVSWIKTTTPPVTYKNWYANLQQVIGKSNYAGSGHWNDPDNLIVGYPRNNQQTFEEQKAQFSFWSLISAPLMLSVDVRKMSPEIKSILLNQEVIAINQDKAGIQGNRIKSDDKHEVWIKKLEDGSKAFILFNKQDVSSKLNFNISDLKMNGNLIFRDLWAHKNIKLDSNLFTPVVAPHGVVMIKVSKIK